MFVVKCINYACYRVIRAVILSHSALLQLKQFSDFNSHLAVAGNIGIAASNIELKLERIAINIVTSLGLGLQLGLKWAGLGRLKV